MNDIVVNRIKSMLQLQGKTVQHLSEETGIPFIRVERLLADELRIHPNEIIKMAKALDTKVETVLAYQHEHSPLQVILNGELTNRRSKRSFEAILYAIEDYVTMKQGDRNNE